MKQTECPICHEQTNVLHHILFTIGDHSDYQIRKCANCRNVYTFFDTEINIAEYYDDKDYIVRDTQKTIFFRLQKFEYRKVIHKIQKLISKQNQSLLDFGSGKGLFLHFAKEEGFEVKGVETSLPRANYAKEKFELTINTDNYFKGKIFDDAFIVITCFHVLEHLTDPNNLLKNLVADNLKNEGLLLIEVPNFKSWQSKWAGKDWLHLDVPRHLSHFSRNQLKKIIEHAGCKIIKQEFFSWHLGIIGMIQTLFSFFGYRKSLIIDLKEKKSFQLIFCIILIFPIAILLESIAAFNKRGGIIRFYAVKRKN